MAVKKIAMVTGAARGLGFEISRQLGEKGYVVYLGSRDLKSGRAKAQSLIDAGIEADYADNL